MRQSWAAVILACVAVSGAVAEEAPPSAEQIAAAKAEGAAILDKAQAADLFDNITRSATIELRHKKSGVRCLFGMEDVEHEVLISPGELPRTDSLRCWATDKSGTRRDLTVIRHSLRPAPDMLFRAYDFAFKYLLVNAEPLPGKFPDMTLGLRQGASPPTQTVRYRTQKDGKVQFARRQMAVVEGWGVASDLITPDPDLMKDDLIGGTIAVGVMNDIYVAQRGGATPPN